MGDEWWCVLLGVSEGEINNGKEIYPKINDVYTSVEPITNKGKTVLISR